MTLERIRLSRTVCSTDLNTEVRGAAAFALGELKEHGAAAVNELLKYVKSDNQDVRCASS